MSCVTPGCDSRVMNRLARCLLVVPCYLLCTDVHLFAYLFFIFAPYLNFEKKMQCFKFSEYTLTCPQMEEVNLLPLICSIGGVMTLTILFHLQFWSWPTSRASCQRIQMSGTNLKQ